MVWFIWQRMFEILTHLKSSFCKHELPELSAGGINGQMSRYPLKCSSKDCFHSYKNATALVRIAIQGFYTGMNK
jgi:hypothetical protein